MQEMKDEKSSDSSRIQTQNLMNTTHKTKRILQRFAAPMVNLALPNLKKIYSRVKTLLIRLANQLIAMNYSTCSKIMVN